MYSKTNSKPNKSDVAQILDLEFEARRAFIDSDATKEEDRAVKIMNAYPCFQDPQHVSTFMHLADVFIQVILHLSTINYIREI